MTADDQRAPEETRRRAEHEQRRSRELAGALAERAEEIATTMDRAAELHDAMSGTAAHPLRESAPGHASSERAFAADEREDAEWLRWIAEGGGERR